MKKKYFTKDERKKANRTQMANYRSTPIGRANHLLTAYRQLDRKYNRGECTLTAEWILQHIFTQPCAHCGETDWRKLGCNRLDETLPHTQDNVEPCCKKCNDELHKKNLEKTVYQYTLQGVLVAIWPSVSECGRNGFTYSAVNDCCNGKRKSHKGHRWSYEPL